MKISIDLSDLARVAQNMNAEPSKWTLGGQGLEPRELLRNQLRTGIEIELERVQPLGPLKLLTFEGEQVILYIRDTRSTLDVLKNRPEESRRYHLAECDTLTAMRHSGRFQRYVVTQNTSGIFVCDYVDDIGRVAGEAEAKLKVCKNCLKTVNWQRSRDVHRSAREAIWSEFDLADFLFEHVTLFHSRPERTAELAGLDSYPADWTEISSRIRSMAKWRCNDCNVDLSEHKHLLHCHHKNGVRGDVQSWNLEAVCMLCHQKKPHHKHLHVPPQHERTLTRLRAEQRF